MFCPACQTEVEPEQLRCGACAQELPSEWGSWIAAGGQLTGLVLEDRYRAERFLARGGMGAVYRGTDLSLLRPVAIKFLDPKYRSDEEVVSRFQQEARSAASLEHANIVPIFSVGERLGHHYFVMKFIEGGTVGDLVRREGRLAMPRALRIALQIARGLQHIHEHGYVHRDVKPSNVMVEPRGHVWILDFGILRHQASTLTQTGLVAGTPEYMAPEQARDVRAASPASDLYSLGVMLFEMLVGHGPFPAETPIDVLAKHLTEPAPRLSAFLPDVPPRVEEIVARALRKVPEERQPTARAMREALETALREVEGRDEAALPAPPVEPRAGNRPLPDETIAMGASGTVPGAGRGAADGLPETRAFVTGTEVASQTLLMGSAGPGDDLATGSGEGAAPSPARRGTPSPTGARSAHRRVPFVPLLVLGIAALGIYLVLAAEQLSLGGEAPRAPAARARAGDQEVAGTRGRAGAAGRASAALRGGAGAADGGGSPGTQPKAANRADAQASHRSRGARLGSLVVRSEPPGALVFLGRRKLGPTPVQRRLAARKHRLVLRKLGYFPERRSVRVRSGKRRVVSVRLRERPAKVQIGLSERGRPSRAEVLLDGRSLGTLSRADRRVRPGRHRIMVRRPGYVTQQKIVDVDRGESERVHFELMKR